MRCMVCIKSAYRVAFAEASCAVSALGRSQIDKKRLGMAAPFFRLCGQGLRRGVDRSRRGLGLAHGRIQTDHMLGQVR